MRQKRDRKKSPVMIAGLTVLTLFLIAGLLIIFMRPEASHAESSMEINGNGVLVRYNIKDGMTQVSVPNNVKAIGNEAFMGDKTLERIYIPGSVKTIGKKAFYGCSRLMEINIREGTEEIKDSAFAMCTGMSRAQLPASLRTLGNGVFAGDTALNQFSFASGNNAFFLNDNVIYNRTSERIIEMIPGRQGDTYVMPFSVKSIAPYAFWGAENLKNVRVSNNVTAITPFAFTNASALEFVFLPNSVNSIQEYAFRDCKKLKYIGTEGNTGFIADSAFYGTNDELLTEDNVSYEEAAKHAVKNSVKTNEKTGGKDKKKTGDNDSKSSEKTDKNSGDDKNDARVSDGGEVVFDTPWGIKAPYKEIDTSDPDLYGTGKIVGGRTVIIPAKKQNYRKVSGNN